MNLDELRSAQAKERRKDSLQHLRDSFYDDVAAYVSDLRAARDRRAEQVAKPFSDDDVRRMSDEVETAEEVAEALYERRVGKVVKLASFAAADMPVDADGMTTEERQLFDDLVERIGRNKSHVLNVLSGETPPTGEVTEGPASAEDAPSATETAPAREGDEQAPPAPEPEPDAGALAGAMGGGDEEVVDDIDAPPADSVSPEADDGATTDGGPTAVPPESAPPGAPGVTDRTEQTGSSEPTGSGVPTETDETHPAESDPSAAAAGGTDVEVPASETEMSGSAETETPGSAETDPSTPADADPPTDDRTTVRITRDVGSIFGVDEREYDLANEDVVTLPVENADPLVQRDAAERLD